jgi:thioredoxin 1
MANAKLYKFWASWCGPCKVMAPVVSQVVSERPEIELIEINVDDNDPRIKEFGIRSIPAFVIESNGKRAVKTGACTALDFARFIDTNV